MVIRPEISSKENEVQTKALPIWEVIGVIEKQTAPAYWLIRQHDHSKLAGDLAAKFTVPWLPKTGEPELGAIREHDCGWNFFPFEHGTDPKLSEAGRPASFMEIPIQQLLIAWRGSIARSESFS